MIGATRDGNTDRINFFIYDKTLGKFQIQELRGLSFANAYVTSVLANDLNSDGFIDLVVSVNYTSGNATDTFVYLNNQVTGFLTKAATITNGGGILLADLNGDRLYNLWLK